MRYSFASVALFGLAAVNAAPMPQQTNYSSLYAAELASMASVQSAMGQGQGGAATATATAAAGDKTTVMQSTVKATSTVTAGGASSAQVSAEAAKTHASSAAAKTAASSAAAASSTAGSTSGGSGSGATVTNQKAFSNGAATKSPKSSPSGPKPVDAYKCYGSNFPTQDKWSSFEDLWTANQKLLSEACTNLGDGADDTKDQIQDIHDAILTVSGDSFVDPRFILAIVMQESHGCVNVGATNNGVSNPGLMQSHNGVSFSASDAKNSITQMIRDGTQGTSSGDGLVQLINKYGDAFSAARAYNSGSIASDGNLNNGNGATKTYVMDVANRLTGWSLTPGTSPSCAGEV